jgi:hypothetical protein
MKLRTKIKITKRGGEKKEIVLMNSAPLRVHSEFSRLISFFFLI